LCPPVSEPKAKLFISPSQFLELLGKHAKTFFNGSLAEFTLEHSEGLGMTPY
jgi:hypothetical protein